MTWNSSGFTDTDRFRVEATLGEGGFGVVYRVHDRIRGESVALKTLHRLDAESLYRLKREFRLLADVSGPNLVKLHELFSDGETWFFTMELIEGRDFFDFVRHRRPSWTEDERETARSLDAERLRWALAELCDGVLGLHRAGRLHRDLKPSNVLVADEGRVVLLDFGLVAEASDTENTASHILGTAAYMAPEQALQQITAESVDWYAVGVMLYQALTGRLPYRGSDIQMMVEKQSVDPPEPIEVDSSLPEDLSTLAMRLLARDPRERLDGQALQAALGPVDEPRVGRESMFSQSWRDLSGDPSTATNLSLEAGEVPLLGRYEELDALHQAFDDVGHGAPVVVEVLGRSGMGKTALIDKFLSHLSRLGRVVVLSGRCYEQETVPFKAVDSVIDALSRYLRGRDDETVAALMPRHAKALARLFPVLERVRAFQSAPEDSDETPDSQALRQRAFVALGELLGRIADRRPLIIAIDDLQWGDLDSAVLLGQVLSGAHPPGMMLVLSYRVEERHRSPFLKEILSGAALRAVSREIEVDALSEDQALDLARAMLGANISETRLRTLVTEAGRSPFIIQALAQFADSAKHQKGVTFEDVVAQVMNGLPDGPRRLLELVSVAGQPLESEVAIHAADLGGEGHRALEALRDSRLIRACAGDERLLEPYHDRLREVIVADLEGQAQRTCHAALAQALEAAGLRDPERLALHFEAANDLVHAAEEAERAAAVAEGKLAFERAARHYRTALAHGRHRADEARNIRLKLGNALANAGRGAEAADQYLAAAKGMARLKGLELRRRAALELLGSGHIERGTDVMRDVLDAVDLRLVRSTKEALASLVAQRIRLKIRGYEFRERPESTVPVETLLKLDTCWACAQGFRMTEVTHALAFASRFLRLALDVGDPSRISLGLSLEATSFVALASNESAQRRAAETLERAGRLGERLGKPSIIAFNHASAGTVAAFCADWEHAVERFDQAIEVYHDRCTGVTLEVAQAQLMLLTALFYRGDLNEISQRSVAIIQEARDRGDLFSSVGFLAGYGFLAWLARDDVETTRRELNQARAAWSVKGYRLQNWLLDLADVYTDLYCGQGRRAYERMSETLRHFRKTPYWQMAWMRSTTWALYGSAALAVAPNSVGSKKRAREIAKSIRELENLRFPLARPWSLLLRAARADQSRSRADAKLLLKDAESHFEALEMPLHAAAAILRRAELSSSDQRDRLSQVTLRRMSDLGARNPEKIGAMIAPGFRSSGSR